MIINIKKGCKTILSKLEPGMLSEEQFEQWINEAKNIAKTYKTIIIGTSHADGFYDSKSDINKRNENLSKILSKDHG